MARFFSRNRSILKYLSKLNRQKSFTDRLTTSTTLQQTSSREEYEADKALTEEKEYNLLTKDDDQKAISDSATVRAIAATLTGSGVSSKDAIINLASSGLTAGDASIVFIDSNNAKYYISNGSGWYNAGLANTDPTWFSQPNPSYALDSTAPLTIEPIAVDSGGKIFSYSASLDNDASQFLTVTKDSANGRIFTITGDSAGAVNPQNSGVVTWRVSDGIGLLTYDTTITLDYISTGTLTRSASSVNEGGSVTFTLPTTGYANGSTFPYTITGISAADITQGLTGNMTVSNNAATVTITTVADVSSGEGAETMTFTADGQSVNVTINDTSAFAQARWWLKANASSYSGGTSSYGPFNQLLTSAYQTQISNNWTQFGSYWGPGGTMPASQWHVEGTTNFDYRANGCTIECWIYHTGSQNGYWDYTAVFAGDTDTSNYKHAYWITSATGTAVGGGNSWGYHSYPFGHNAWRHYAWVWDTNGHHKLFVGGVGQSTPYATYVSPGTYLNFQILNYNGYVQDLRVSNWNRYTPGTNFTPPARGSNNL